MARRKEESFAKRQFDQFLSTTVPDMPRHWIDVPLVDEPPDFYLFLDSVTFAVEVSALVEKVRVGSRTQLPRRVAVEHLRALVQDCESLASQRDLLSGQYVVRFSGTLTDLPEIRALLMTAILDYVEMTKQVDTSPYRLVFRQRGEHRMEECGVLKASANGARIVFGGLVFSRWEVEAERILCTLLGAALASKSKKLQRLREPKILLLIDRYPFGHREMYTRISLAGLPLGGFHTVYVVRHDQDGFVLYTASQQWA